MQIIRIIAAAVSVFAALWDESAEAQGTIYYMTYVSNTGNDTTSCGSPTSPCQSFNQAMLNTVRTGIVQCLGPTYNGNYTTITKSITIDCTSVSTNIFQNTGVGFTVNITDSADTDKAVYIRGVNFASYQGTGVQGFLIQSANLVVLDRVSVVGDTKHGVADLRTTAGTLVIKDSVFSGNKIAGIVVAGPSGHHATLENVTSTANAYGVAVGAGNNVDITRSVFTKNTTAGVEADGGSLVVVDGSTISANNVGIQSGSAIRLSNNNLTFNTTAVNGATGTFGNNRFSGNGSDGTALTPVGAGSTDLAQK